MFHLLYGPYRRHKIAHSLHLLKQVVFNWILLFLFFRCCSCCYCETTAFPLRWKCVIFVTSLCRVTSESNSTVATGRYKRVCCICYHCFASSIKLKITDMCQVWFDLYRWILTYWSRSGQKRKFNSTRWEIEKDGVVQEREAIRSHKILFDRKKWNL